VAFFFFSSRRRHTRFSRDWSSDVCSSDLISSIGALTGSPGRFVHYAGSKAAVDTMTKGLAVEVAREGIRINAIRPGMIDTPIHEIGRASCRERVELSVRGESLQKK